MKPDFHHLQPINLFAYLGNDVQAVLIIRPLLMAVLIFGWMSAYAPLAMASHQGHEGHAIEKVHEPTGPGYAIPGVPFKVYLEKGKGSDGKVTLDQSQAEAAIQTVVQAFTQMVDNRSQYQRFDEAVTKNMLQTVIIEPKVLNRDGKEFSFLVARTKDKGRVKLLISASALDEKGYLHHPEKLVPVLAREFQWVISKADSTPKRKMMMAHRDLEHAPIKTNKEIRDMSGEEREQVLEKLFETYLSTEDDYQSLKNQPFYQLGTTSLVPPAQPDSTTKFYDIRVREALQKIVRDPYFAEQTPKAVRSLLNGKICNVSFVKIDKRDWATRTRVVPKDQSVNVGNKGESIQPAKILVNVYRTASPEDPFYPETKDLPMGALSTDQLARVIAVEIENNIIEKSMRGHVAQDEKTAPK